MRQLKIIKQITNRDSGSLDKYLQEVGKKRQISAEEEVQLARRIKLGDDEALQRLAEANLRFVVSVAKQYQNYGVSLPDLINYGNIGLVKAAEKFDETRGFKFISYAVWWIRQSILQGLAEEGRSVRLPLNKISQRNKVNKAFSRLEQELEREPTSDEVAEAFAGIMDPNKVKEALHFSHGVVYGDDYVGSDDDSTTLFDIFLKQYPAEENESKQKDIGRLLKQLPEREEGIIRFFFGIGCEQLTLEEIGTHYNLTRERVRQLKEKSIKRLKQIVKRHPELFNNYLC